MFDLLGRHTADGTGNRHRGDAVSRAVEEGSRDGDDPGHVRGRDMAGEVGGECIAVGRRELVSADRSAVRAVRDVGDGDFEVTELGRVSPSFDVYEDEGRRAGRPAPDTPLFVSIAIGSSILIAFA